MIVGVLHFLMQTIFHSKNFGLVSEKPPGVARKGVAVVTNGKGSVPQRFILA